MPSVGDSAFPWKIKEAGEMPAAPVGCHNARTAVLDRAFLDRQVALWYSLINPLTAVRRLIRAVMSMASLGSCTGG
jgi:hypothetical protein